MTVLYRRFFYNFLLDPTGLRLHFIQKFAPQFPKLSIRLLIPILLSEMHLLTRTMQSLLHYKSLVHGDLKPENVLVAPSGKVIVLYWEKSCFTPTILDIGLSVFHLLCSLRLGILLIIFVSLFNKFIEFMLIRRSKR